MEQRFAFSIGPRWARLAAMAAASLALGGIAAAADDPRADLQLLRQRGAYVEALEKLDELCSDADLPEETQRILDYEQGATLLAAAKGTGDPSVRRKRLEGAKAALERFLEESPQHALCAAAREQLGGALVELGRLSGRRAATAGISTAQRRAAAEEARLFYRAAEGCYVLLEAAAAEELRKLPKIALPGNQELRQAQQSANRTLLEARTAGAAVAYETAQIYAPGSRDWRTALELAAARYHDCFEKHGPLLGGLYARLWEGRTRRELGEYDAAMRVFSEILAQPDEPAAIRELKNKALALFLETAIMPQVKRYREAVAMYREWDAAVRPGEGDDDDALAVRYFGGKAALDAARAVHGDEAAHERTENLRVARDALEIVRGSPGRHQALAREELLAPEFAPKESVAADACDYVDERELALAALERMRAADAARKAAAGAKPEDRERPELAYITARDEALRRFRAAADAVPSETPAEELSAIRYYLCYLYWASDCLEEAAVCGEFLARQHPDAAGAKPALKIAMAAAARLAAGGTGDEAAFYRDRLAVLAELASRQWPGDSAADQAWMALAAWRIQQRDALGAAEAIDKIPEGSPVRSEAELMAGESLWHEYLRAACREGSARPQPEPLNRFLETAQAFLEQGIGHAEARERAAPTTALAAAYVSLAEIALETNRADEAVRLLEVERFGPLALLSAEDPAARKIAPAAESYRAALRAYVAAGQDRKAEDLLGAMERQIRRENRAQANKRLSWIAIGLGRDLERRLERLRLSGAPDEAAGLTQSCERFLARIIERGSGNTFHALNTAAEAYAGLGWGLASGGGVNNSQAASCFRQAAAAYEKLLHRLSDPQFAAPEGAACDIRIRLARCRRGLGQWEEAMALLRGALKGHPNLIEAQMEAAYTCQSRGNDDPAYFEFALGGIRGDTEVWGWELLVKRLKASARGQDILQEACYNMAWCRCRLAETLPVAKRAALWSQAEAELSATGQPLPSGDDAWRDKRDDLLQRLQRLRAETAQDAMPSGRGRETDNQRREDKTR